MNKGPVMPLLSLADESHHDFPGDPYALSKNKKPLLREALEVGVISSHPRTVYGGEPHRLGGKLYVVRQGFVNINLQDVWQLPRDKEETSWSCSVGLNPCFFALPRMPVMQTQSLIFRSDDDHQDLQRGQGPAPTGSGAVFAGREKYSKEQGSRRFPLDRAEIFARPLAIPAG